MYECTECHAISAKILAVCPACGKINTMKQSQQNATSWRSTTAGVITDEPEYKHKVSMLLAELINLHERAVDLPDTPYVEMARSHMQMAITMLGIAADNQSLVN